MELGAIIELFGGRGRSTLGKKTPLYSGGNKPTVTPTSAPQRAVLPLGRAVLPVSQRYCRAKEGSEVLDPERYYRGGKGGTTA